MQSWEQDRWCGRFHSLFMVFLSECFLFDGSRLVRLEMMDSCISTWQVNSSEDVQMATVARVSMETTVLLWINMTIFLNRAWLSSDLAVESTIFLIWTCTQCSFHCLYLWHHKSGTKSQFRMSRFQWFWNDSRQRFLSTLILSLWHGFNCESYSLSDLMLTGAF